MYTHTFGPVGVIISLLVFSTKEQNWFSQLEKYSCSNSKAALDHSGDESLVKIVIASLAWPRRSILDPVFHQGEVLPVIDRGREREKNQARSKE